MASRIKYLWLLGFQIILVILFFSLVRYDGANEVNIRGYEDIHVMIYVGFGFLMTFLLKYCYGAVGINLFLAALVAQWSIITQGIFSLRDMTIPLNKKVILEADVMTATVLITYGVLLGRASVNQLLFIAIVETFIGSLNLHILEAVIQASDVGGAIAIHTYGAFFGLAVSAAWVCGKRRELDDAEHPFERPSYMTDVTAMIGSLFLFIYWSSFNARLTGSDADYQRAVVNTYVSLAACAVVTFILSAFLNHGKFSMEHVQNSTLAGGVGVGSVCNMHITPGGAMLIGMGAAFISVFGISKIKPFLIRKFGLLDTCSVLHLHGFPGVYSGLLSCIVAAAATKSVYGDEGMKTVFEAVAHGRATATQGLMQFVALAVTLVMAIFFGVLTGCIAKLKIFEPLSRPHQFNDEHFWELP